MTRSKKIIIGTMAIGIITALSIGGTLAFLTDTEKVTNHFSVGDLDITIDEPKWDDEGTPDDDGGTPDDPSDDTPGTPGDGQDLVPGDTREKDPTITAVTGDSYVRVIVNIQDKAGIAITDAERLDKILKTVYYAEPVLNESNKYSLEQLSGYSTVNSEFKLVEDNSSAGSYCYNYDGILEEGSSVVLFTNIVIPTDWNQADLAVLGEYQIEIYAQAIQSDNFSGADEAFSALDAEIKAGTIQEDYATVGGVTVS